MKKKNKLIISVATIGAFSLISVYGISNASADTSFGRDGVIDRLVSRFNLNKNDVEKVFEENQAARQAERKTEIEEKLNQAVSEGKLTNDQKNALIQKMDEMRARRDDLRNLSREERRQKMTEHRTEMQKWASDNGIDFTQLGLFLGRGLGEGNGLGRNK